jgi:hypothetical protein
MFATFSPCGNKVAYVRDNNLYVQDVHTFKITALTSDGSSMVINGTFDWVYEEEFRLRRGFRWSPDSKSIAFWQIHQEGVRVVNLINNTDHLYPQLIPIPYPKAGEQNASCRIGVVPVKGEEGEDEDDHCLEAAAKVSLKNDVVGVRDSVGSTSTRARGGETEMAVHLVDQQPQDPASHAVAVKRLGNNTLKAAPV